LTKFFRIIVTSAPFAPPTDADGAGADGDADDGAGDDADGAGDDADGDAGWLPPPHAARSMVMAIRLAIKANNFLFFILECSSLSLFVLYY